MPTIKLESSSQTTSTKEKKGYYPALTGLRAIAAYMVVLFHENGHNFLDTSQAAGLLPHFVSTWSAGVAIFFVLSGFLITLRYGQTVELTGSFLRRYFQNRFARIYPVYFLLTAVTLILFKAIPHVAPASFTTLSWKDNLVILFLNLTLLRGFFQDLFTAGVAPAWSLTVEETFYLVAPVLLLLIRQRWWPLVLYPVLFTAAGLGLTYLFQGSRYGFFGSLEYVTDFTFFGRCVEFIVGMAVGKFFNRISAPKGFVFTGLGVAGIVLCLLGLTALNLAYTPSQPGTGLGFTLLSLYGLPLPIALLLIGLTKETTWLSSFLSLSWMQKLGTASYALYLLHFGPLPTLISEMLSDLLLVKLLIYTVLALFLYKFIEHPLHTKLRASK